MAQAQDLPADSIQISPSQAAALNVGRLYRLSSWQPGSPPLAPAVLFTLLGLEPDGSGQSESATNYTIYFSQSLNALVLDDRQPVGEQMLLAAAANGNRQVFQAEDQAQQDDSDSPTLDTTGLYLQLTNLDTAQAYLNLYNASDQVYAIWSSTGLLTGWNVAAEVWPTNADVQPFTLPISGQDTFFAFAQDWTGVTENGNTTPDWWLWKFFGNPGLTMSDSTADSSGTNTLLSDYTSGRDPNIIAFTISTTNPYVNQTTLPVQISLVTGWPSYYAVLLNDTNTADANWLAYPGTNLTVNLGSTDGTYNVSVGLRGLPASATQSWQSLTAFRDTTPLTLTFTNLPAFSGSRPFIDPAGYTTRALSALTWTVVDATGATNTGNGMVVAQGWSLADPYHVTNWFQAVDLALALGTNWVSLQAVDWAGTVAVTNFAWVFDTNGDVTPPAFTLIWPPDGTQVSGDSFTVQAWMDDDTAAVALQYTDTNGIVQTVNGQVERGGNVWVPSVPLVTGTNSFSLLATDAAGNVSTNNFTVVQTIVGLTIDPLSQDQMKSGYVTVTGEVDDPDCTITVNGVTGVNYGDGYWEVDNVPLPPGGSVVLQATAQFDAPLQLNQSRALRATAQSSGGTTVQTLLEQARGPIVFTQTYEYNLDYTFSPSTNTFEGHHFALHWARGTGGSNTETSWSVDAYGNVSSNLYTVVWPPDNGYVPTLEAQAWGGSYWNGVLTDSRSSTQPAPSVQWMEKSTSAGSWPNYYQASWSESSSREVRLFTGGSGTRQSKGLFNLSASLTYESLLDTNRLGDWSILYWPQAFIPFLESTAPPVGAPPQQITLGTLGNLGSDAHLFTVQSSGNELIITPKASGTFYSGYLPSAVEHKLVITANGTNLDDATPEFCVGQKVNLVSSWVPDLPQGTQSSLDWLIGPSYVNTNDPAHDGIAPVYRVDHTLETNASVPVWWYDQGGSRYVRCTWTCAFANGQSAVVSKNGFVSVYRPSVTNFVCPAPRSFMWLPGTKLSYGDRDAVSDGMNWTAQITSKYDGRHGLTQVFSALYSVSPTLLPPPIDTLYCGGADAGEFYDIGDTSESPDDGTFTYWVRYAVTHEATFQDYPNLTYRVANVTGEIQIADAADYIRFKPGTGHNDGNIYVTLGVVHWNADGSYNILTGWNANSTPAASGPDGSYAFPFWCSTIHSVGN
jgi:hypothetical protein